jgi:hypothetical protein
MVGHRFPFSLFNNLRLSLLSNEAYIYIEEEMGNLV